MGKGGFALRVCRGCRHTAIDVTELQQEIEKVIEEYRHLFDDESLMHRRFKIAIAGCPNSCTLPQIVDFGVQGKRRPASGEAPCTLCGICVETCPDQAISLGEEKPVFDRDRCLDCGQCIRDCPTGHLTVEAGGCQVLLGGKGGRHPCWGVPVEGWKTPKEAAELLREQLEERLQGRLLAAK